MKKLEDLYSLPLSQLPITVIDLETTGLRPQLDAICEIGAVRIETGQLTETHSTLVQPQRPIPQEAVDIHNITPEMLKDAPLLEDVMPAFLGFLGSTVIAGHNVGFDLSFLHAASLPWGVDLYQRPILDTAHLARKLLPKQQSYALVALAERYNLPSGAFHRALDDAQTTGYLLLMLLQEAEKQGMSTLAQLEQRYPFPGTPPAIHQDTPPLEKDLWLAIQHHQKVIITYRNARNEARERHITPERLVSPFLYAYCHLRQEHRSFRLDRIERYKILEETAQDDAASNDVSAPTSSASSPSSDISK
ncbi:MAG: WYL domain-containing protein [Myxococcales bacterium]|nr:WYL domain-containing protein [Myxococcales bacterium]